LTILPSREKADLETFFPIFEDYFMAPQHIFFAFGTSKIGHKDEQDNVSRILPVHLPCILSMSFSTKLYLVSVASKQKPTVSPLRKQGSRAKKTGFPLPGLLKKSRLLRRYAPPKKINVFHIVKIEIATVACGSFAMTELGVFLLYAS